MEKNQKKMKFGRRFFLTFRFQIENLLSKIQGKTQRDSKNIVSLSLSHHISTHNEYHRKMSKTLTKHADVLMLFEAYEENEFKSRALAKEGEGERASTQEGVGEPDEETRGGDETISVRENQAN